jgi:tetratricopeptide (TPR) repeat protein
LHVAEGNLYHAHFFLGQIDAASETLRTFLRDAERYGGALDRPVWQSAEAHDLYLHGRWEQAERTLDELLAKTEAGVAHYTDPACLALRAVIALARGELVAASADSKTALARAQRTKDPQLLAPALALGAIVLLAQDRQEDASDLATEVLALGSITALLEWRPAATPIEFAWLLRDLGRHAELLPALAAAPPTPWFEAARAIARGDFSHGVEVVARIGAPAVEAYTRLRTAEQLAGEGHHAEARDCLAPALAFFKKAGATRYRAQAEQVLAPAA